MKKAPSPLVSLIPIIVLVLLLFATIRTFGSDALSGGSQVSLLTTTAICILIGMVFYKIPWKDYELAITNNIAGVATAIIILLIIGALSGIWMISGVVPTLIYYGMQIIHPSFFLASTCIICALISVMTGSSWTTIATIGIALMGIGKAQGLLKHLGRKCGRGRTSRTPTARVWSCRPARRCRTRPARTPAVPPARRGRKLRPRCTALFCPSGSCRGRG